MSVFTLVQRVLPFSLPWKRRHSTISKGKEREADTSSHDAHEDTVRSGNENCEHTRTTLPRDVFDTVHIAVKTSPDSSMSPVDSSSEIFGADSDSESEYQVDQISDSDHNNSTRTTVSRVVVWASIVRNKHRWTKEQENKLLNARAQLARCQKAWSSEQELWLEYIQTLNDEKEAHEEFLLMRARQQQEERYQFRKAWRRRRSGEDMSMQNRVDDGEKGSTNGLGNLRLLQRYGSFVSNLPMTESTVVACRG